MSTSTLGGQGLHDLDDLRLRRTQVGDVAVRGDVDLHAPGQRQDLGAGGRAVDPAQRLQRLAPEQDVVLDGELGQEVVFLVNDADPHPGGLQGISDFHGFSVEEDLTRVGAVAAGKDLDQGRLAGPVLPGQGVHFPFRQPDADVIEGHHPGEALGDVPQLQDHGADRAISLPGTAS